MAQAPRGHCSSFRAPAPPAHSPLGRFGGDRVEVRIPGIGSLQNPVVKV